MKVVGILMLVGIVLFVAGGAINKLLRTKKIEFGSTKWKIYEKVSDSLLYLGVLFIAAGVIVGGVKLGG